MTFIAILETLFIGPLKILFELIYSFSKFIFQNSGLSIVSLSLLMNLLVLPLYKRADEMQEEARNIEKKLHDGVAHIKKSFSGDEKMMILQAYYRQNNYKPTDALKGSVSLLLQIPFFMAAYQFLSNLSSLQGTSLGPIKDLSAPDGLLVIGGFAINLLPIIMTLVNVISSAIYLKGFPAKTKVQIYGMALFFLVFLYTSPSGLVFYWTLNNVFSLFKTIYYKIKNRQRFLSILISLSGIVFIVLSFAVYSELPSSKYTLLVAGILMQFALVYPVIKAKFSKTKKEFTDTPNKKLFITGSLFLTTLVGVLISSTLIASSPQEFVDPTYFHNPLWHILSTLCLAAGLFMVWFRVFYWLATPKGKVIFERVVWILSGTFLINYMFFGTKLGVISSSLVYETGLSFKSSEKIINLFVVIACVIILYYIAAKWSKVASTVLIIAIVAIGAMSVVNVFTIKNSIDNMTVEDPTDIPQFQLSKDGQNVVVIMVDRGAGEYVPFIFNEKPELKEQFDGFTYYSNTISYGAHTNFAVSAIYGGYEYTPVEMNRRDDVSLEEKHNEALQLMPHLFTEEGYDVTVIDPPYGNYNNHTDLSVYDDYPDVNTYIAKGKFSDDTLKQLTIESNYRNFFCFSIMKCLPLYAQASLYSNGGYHNDYHPQKLSSLSTASGVIKDFRESIEVLRNLPTMSNVTDSSRNTFSFIYNDAPHKPALLQTPDYELADTVDNTEYDAEHADRFTLEGNTIEMTTKTQIASYHSNMATFIEIGKWLDYLKENDVYDNTKIIIVSDHGYALHHYEDLEFAPGKDSHKNIEYYLPLLIVKDFNAEGFTVSDEFMTNADVPVIATDGLIENPVNPFTGQAINSDEKYAHDQFIILSDVFSVKKNDGNTFLPSAWAKVSEDAWVADNWSFYDEEVVLKEHSFPD